MTPALHCPLPKKCRHQSQNSFLVADNDNNSSASLYKPAPSSPSHQLLHNQARLENQSLVAAFLSEAPNYSAANCYLAQSLWSSPCGICTLCTPSSSPVRRMHTHIHTQYADGLVNRIGPVTSGFSQLATKLGHLLHKLVLQNVSSLEVHKHKPCALEPVYCKLVVFSLLKSMFSNT